MSDIILNINDPNFKTLVQKLKDNGWVENVIMTPKTDAKKAHFEFQWSLVGQLCATALVSGMMKNEFGDRAKAFLKSLNEQEDAFFRDNFLDAFPRK